MVRTMLMVALALASATPAVAQIDARMFRQPAVSADKIAFVYAGDIWLVPKTGGTATRLSSPLGEETFPRFSPDGTMLAYSADYDGNTDVYVVPVAGGEPVRLTHHPMADRVIGWHPDGKRVLFASARESGRQRYNQFYLVRRRPAACPRNCRCRTASSAPSRPTARASSTCRCRRTSATGSATAAAGRRT